MIEWYRLLFWLIGQGILCLIRLDFANFEDTLYWIRIHWSCNSTCVNKYKLPIIDRIKNTSIELLGFIVLCIITIILIKLCLLMLVNILMLFIPY